MKPGLALATLMVLAAGPAAAAEISVEDGFFLIPTPMARSAAAYMTIVNRGEADDRLAGVASDIAARVELHTSRDTDEGVIEMRAATDGFVVPSGGSHALSRGGDHVMFMGLTTRPEASETVAVTLSFENAGEITVELPVRTGAAARE